MSGDIVVVRRDVDVGDGLRLHVALAGSGPPLVLLHGFTGSTETWAPFRATLGAAHTTIAVDLPGHGRSSVPRKPSRYALGRFANDLARVLDTLAIERVALLGYSMGGRAALRFALTHPHRVAALVLESTSDGIADAGERAARVASDAALADSIDREGTRGFVERWERLPQWSSQRTLSDEARARLRAQREANQAAGLANSLRGAGAGVDEAVLGRLSTIGVPVLLIVGALDTAYLVRGRRMEETIPAARMTVVSEAGHAVHLERPTEFVSAVAEFLRAVPSASGHWQ